MRVLAIDASTKSSGIAIFDNQKLVFYKCLTENNSNFLIRIPKMTKQIIDIYKEYKPSNIIMEEVLPEEVKHNQSTYKALIYLQALIVLSISAIPNSPKVEFYVSSEWRKKCGIRTGAHIKREALKAAAQDKVKTEYGIVANDDICDAICIGYAYTHQKIVTDTGFEFK
jgi:Holliday junction resolvasome RuvABC endonuclease subunit